MGTTEGRRSVLSSSLSRWFHRNKKHKTWWLFWGDDDASRCRRFEHTISHEFRHDDSCDSCRSIIWRITRLVSKCYAVINWLWWLLIAPALLLRFVLPSSRFHSAIQRLVIMISQNLVRRFFPPPSFVWNRWKSAFAILLVFNLCTSLAPLLRRSEDTKCIHNFPRFHSKFTTLSALFPMHF